MKHLLTLGSFAVALFATSCEQQDREENVSAQDRTFVNEITLSNRTEIVLSNMALTRATNDSVRMYAQMMIADHTNAENELKDLVDDLDIDLPADSLNAMGATMRTTLMGLTGRAFDSAYISGQVPAHQASLQIAENEINTGTNGQLRNYATSKQPVIRMHLTLAETIAARFK